MASNIERNEMPSAREFASDCLAWRIDVPASGSFLSGSMLSNAIHAAASSEHINLHRAENIATIPGLGITARIDGAFVVIGTEALFASLDIRVTPSTLQSIAQIRLRGNDTILIGSWKGVTQIVEIANPVNSRKVA